MKPLFRSRTLPAAVLGLGGIAMLLRKLLYLLAVDEYGLLVTGHPLDIALSLVTGAALLTIAVTVRKLDGSNEYAHNFSPSTPAALGQVLAATGIGVTVLFNAPIMEGYLGTAWRVLGYASPVCLVLTGCARMEGRKPFFLLPLVPTAFLVVHVINHYQVWCGNPQFQDYLPALLGTIALLLHSFYTAAFSVDLGNRRMQLAMGLAAAYLCMMELADSRYPYLYLGAVVWAVTGLCSLKPTPKPEPAEPESPSEDEA